MVKYLARTLVVLIFILSGVAKLADYRDFEKETVAGFERLDAKVKTTWGVSLPVPPKLIQDNIKLLITSLGGVMTVAAIMTLLGVKWAIPILILMLWSFNVVIHNPALFEDPVESQFHFGQLLRNLGIIGGLLLILESK